MTNYSSQRISKYARVYISCPLSGPRTAPTDHPYYDKSNHKKLWRELDRALKNIHIREKRYGPELL